MKRQVQLVGEFLTKNESWTYLAMFLVISYAIVGINADIELRYYVSWVCTLSVIYCSIFVFSNSEEAIRTKYEGWYFWAWWFLAYFFLPLLIYIIVSKTPIAQQLDLLLNFKFIKNSDTILMFTLFLSPALYFLLKVSTHRKRLFSTSFWVKKVSFFSIVLFAVILISLALPLFSTDFQSMASSNTKTFTFFKYLFYVPQVFLIYFSYYMFYYINHYLLFREVLMKKGIVYYFVGVVGMIFLLTPLHNVIIRLFPVVSELRIHPLGIGVPLIDSLHYLYPILVTLLSFPVIVFIEWNRKESRLKELQKQNVDAELSLLKQQINPHFFFNTLNNLYALSLAKSDQAPATILKLSKLMRFVIYKGQQEYVTLEEEVKYIKDYIDLQKIRMNKKVDIRFNVNLDNPELQIPPLLFIIIVENAFKHGIEPSEKDGYIHIDLEATHNMVKFKCSNSVDKEGRSISEEGIGLKNLQQRLDIGYPDRYDMSIESKEGEYKVNLTIEL